MLKEITDTNYADQFQQLVTAVGEEIANSKQTSPEEFDSHGEGYFMIDEKLEELWDETNVKEQNYDYKKMRRQCIAIAAMALRFAIELTPEEK